MGVFGPNLSGVQLEIYPHPPDGPVGGEGGGSSSLTCEGILPHHTPHLLLSSFLHLEVKVMVTFSLPHPL